MNSPSFTLFLFITVSLLACSKKSSSAATEQKLGDHVDGTERLAVSDASLEECATGGNIYYLYLDQNENRSLDSEDDVIHQQVVCNGANGLSSLINTDRVNIGFSACLAGSGLQIGTGLDANRNSILDASEITGAQILCDGGVGATGAAGPAGSDGFNMVFETAPAASGACEVKGVTMVMALDTDRSGIVSVGDQSFSSVTLCDGRDGTDADLPAYTPVAPIYACGDSVAYKEVLLRLNNGQVLASFSNTTSGDMTRLAFIPDGTFMNTDNSGCTFTLATSADGQMRSISWDGEVQESWSMP
jgi:hypothetical protein